MARRAAVLVALLACACTKTAKTEQAAAEADCRAILEAEQRYQADTAAGNAAPLACLVDPRPCVPAYDGPPFLDLALTAPEKGGYYRQFHDGAPIDLGEAASRRIARVHLRSWAYTARPAAGVPGAHLCVDSTGRLCQARTPLAVAAPACPPPPQCADLP
jgi:hypothetical protein